MRAALIHGPGDVRLEDRPDPTIQSLGDAVVRVVRTCVCGSDLWPYRGIQKTTEPHPIGHEFIGVVEATGAEVSTVQVGDFVIAPFTDNGGTCVHCRNGITTSCVNFGFWGHTSANGEALDGAQGQYVPFADGTLVKVPGTPDAQLYPHLLTLSDVLATGHHAARSGDVRAGATVVIVGDGAVGLCAVLAAKRLGAARGHRDVPSRRPATRGPDVRRHRHRGRTRRGRGPVWRRLRRAATPTGGVAARVSDSGILRRAHRFACIHAAACQSVWDRSCLAG